MSRRPSVTAFGDAAVLADLGDVDGAQRLARSLTGTGVRWPWVEDVVVGFGTVTVVVDPWRADLDELLDEVTALAAVASAGPEDAAATAEGGDTGDGGDTLEVAVRFDGPDLADVAAAVGWRQSEVVDRLADSELRVAFVGFSPGFAYLVGLPSELASVPRRPRPRPEVPAGSVAVGGGFAGIYPQRTPGGWHVVGRTGLALFDPTCPPFALLRPGQRLRFRPCDDEIAPTPAPRRAPLVAGEGRAGLVVEAPGACTLVEDGGRRGVGALGVPRAGACDMVALWLANRLVGNAEGDAALEVTGRGPVLRAVSELHVAVLGDPVLGDPAPSASVEVHVDGRPAPAGEVVPVAPGQVLDVGATGDSVRAVVAVSGGVRIEPLLGSRSSDLLCGLGPGPLRPGDVLPVGPAGRPRGRLSFTTEAPGAEVPVLRVLPGPDAPGPDSAGLARRLGGQWWVSPASNRVGVRLATASTAGLERGLSDGADDAGRPSRGMVAGAVQLPPGGEAIVLGPDHATVGGYRVAAVVVSADLHRLAHLAPGSPVRFEVVDRAEAAVIRRRLRAALSEAVHGWFPTRAG